MLTGFTCLLVGLAVLALLVIYFVDARGARYDGSPDFDRISKPMATARAERRGGWSIVGGALGFIYCAGTLLKAYVIAPDPDRTYALVPGQRHMMVYQWQWDVVLAMGACMAMYAFVSGIKLWRLGPHDSEKMPTVQPTAKADEVMAAIEQDSSAQSNYPRDSDAPWVAVDRLGRIAIVTTAGDGPIPEAQLLRWDEFEELSEELLAYPATSDFELVTDVERSDDFVRVARHGYFSFDWTRTVIGHASYRMLAKPTRPVTLESRSWSSRVMAALKVCQSQQLNFDDAVLDASAAFRCGGPAER